MKKITFLSIAFMLALTLVTPALAENQPENKVEAKETKKTTVVQKKFVRRPVNVQGELVSMSQTTLPATLVVKVSKLSPKKNKNWVGAYPETSKELTVNVNISTKFVRKYFGKSSLEELTVGDKLDLTVKTNEDGTVTATRVKNDTLQWAWKIHNGTIESLDITAQTFTLKQNDKKSVVVKVDAKTKVLVPPYTSTSSVFANLQNGQIAHVRGIINTKTKAITASLVRVSVPKEVKPIVATITTPIAQ